MEYTKLGNTGLDVSRICLGCMGTLGALTAQGGCEPQLHVPRCIS
jgi:aryl-alcohol dehydrogenase-like predicted oxidoreductase